MHQLDRLEWLKMQSKNLSEAETRLLFRIQAIIINRAQMDAEIEILEKAANR